MAWTADLESLTVRMISPTDGRATRWATFFAENGWIQWLGDGSIMTLVAESQRIVTLYRVRGAGRVNKVGTIPRPVDWVSISRDGRRAVVTTRDFRGDIWLARVVRVGR